MAASTRPSAGGPSAQRARAQKGPAAAALAVRATTLGRVGGNRSVRGANAVQSLRLPTARVSKPLVSKAYLQYVRQWHATPLGSGPAVDEHGRPLLVLVALNTGDRVALRAASERGGFAARDLDRASYVLREPSTGNQHPVEPRTLDAICRIQAHFDAPEVRIISGYRTPHGGHSNHGKGRAIDFIIPGVADEAVARFARTLGFVGVGIYPTSGFVHVDVRDRSYFWVDASGPGRRNRERGILGELAKRSDFSAVARGERAIGPFAIATDVDSFLATEPPTRSPAPIDEDEEDESRASRE